MSDLKFADTHNLVAFLSKPAKSEGFEQIVDFLNANPIKYALTVNPIIILHVLNSSAILLRRDLQLKDAEGIDCPPNATIFEQLTHMGNIKREGKGFSRRVTPLFPTMMVQAQEELGEGSDNPTDQHHTPIITQPSTSQPQKKQKPRKPKRKDTEIPQSSGLTEPITDEAVNEENVPTHSNDPLLSGEDSLKLNDLMEICTKLQQRVLDLENTKTAQAQEISSLKSAQVVSSEDESLGDKEDASKQERKIYDIDKDVEDVVEKEVSTADPVTTGGEVVTTASVEVSAATTTTTTAITEVDLTLAQALAELRSAKPKVVIQEPVQNTTITAPSTIPKAKSISFRDPVESTTRTTLTLIPSSIKDKGKAKMIEPEKPLKKKEQIRLDEELAFKLQAEEEEKSRLAREKAEKVEESNISWDNVQAMIEADRLLAERLQAREQEELTDEEKARLFVELLEKRKKHFAALRAQEKRNKPPTKAQKKSTMLTYMKYIAGYKQSQLKNKSFVEIQKLFYKAMTRVNMFVDMDTELVKESSKKAEAEMAQESSLKKAGDELEQEKEKKQKIDNDQEEAEMKKLIEVISDEEEVAIDVIPLATKPLSIMLRDFDREDLETLWKLVKAKHGSTRPEEGYERVLWGDLRTMPNTRSGASRTRNRNGGTENGGNGNGGNRNGGNGNRGNRNGGANRNGNGNGGGNGYNFGGFMPAQECTYQDFLKCQPLSFNGMEGVVGLTRLFEKIETVFHISNCPKKYQVKYATCTLLNSALTWWNSHKRTIRIEAAYAMSWAELMKLMTEVYCPRNEVQKMETELWNLDVKGNDLTAYTRRF
ncbi:retrovirus-related pol polyprotein from transposon TNT 1-94 [Tanacetum coccineum]